MLDIRSVDYKTCTGCAACMNLCPKAAISMKENGEGFLYPVIDDNKCIHCGLCYKKCPAIDYKFNTPLMPECYAVWAEKDIREKSSSGGMFTVLALDVLDKKGVVIGAAWNDKFHVEHIIIDSEKELYRLRSSKYIQSYISDTLLQQVKCMLEAGRYVLFSGCPCQVAGLKNFLGRDYDNLLTVDVVCHGVPSPLALDIFVSEVANGRKIKRIDFRDKKYFGWQTITAFEFESGENYVKNYAESPWHKAFANGIFLRECCAQCKYAKTQRVGDITLGDFWQIHKIEPKCNDWRGTGLVLLNTKKGALIFNQLRNKLKLCEQMNLQDELPFNGQLRAPAKITPLRREFFKYLTTNKSFLKAMDYTESDKRDVGIIGFWSANNYGSVITYFALKKVIEGLGYSVGMIELPVEFNDTFNDCMSRRFIEKHYYTTGKVSKNKYRDFNSRFNTFVIGSDQVWNPAYIRNYGYYMFMDFVDENKKKIAYAASIGKDNFDVPYRQKQETAYYLNKINYVSVREDRAVQTCKEDLNYDTAVHVLDPVWLCSEADYDDIIKDAKFKEEDDFIFSYILDPTKDKKDAIEYAVNKLGMKHYNIADVRHKFKEGDIIIPNTISNASMDDWLYCLKKSKYVITDSHHGIVFALIFNKPFICFANPSRTMSRFTSLFKLLDIEDRLVYSPTIIMQNDYYFSKIDYNKINLIVKKEKQKSLTWLKKALDSQIENNIISDYDILYSKIKNVGDNCWRNGEELKKICAQIELIKQEKNLDKENIDIYADLEERIKTLETNFSNIILELKKINK